MDEKTSVAQTLASRLEGEARKAGQAAGGTRQEAQRGGGWVGWAPNSPARSAMVDRVRDLAWNPFLSLLATSLRKPLWLMFSNRAISSSPHVRTWRIASSWCRHNVFSILTPCFFFCTIYETGMRGAIGYR